MGTTTQTHCDNLSSPDGNVRYAALTYMEKATE
jgi:hypothetical protein